MEYRIDIFLVLEQNVKKKIVGIFRFKADHYIYAMPACLSLFH